MLILLHDLDGIPFAIRIDSIKKVSQYRTSYDEVASRLDLDGGEFILITESTEDVLRFEQEAYEKANRKGGEK